MAASGEPGLKKAEGLPLGAPEGGLLTLPNSLYPLAHWALPRFPDPSAPFLVVCGSGPMPPPPPLSTHRTTVTTRPSSRMSENPRKYAQPGT